MVTFSAGSGPVAPQPLVESKPGLLAFMNSACVRSYGLPRATRESSITPTGFSRLA
jgi:hypothetical protein